MVVLNNAMSIRYEMTNLEIWFIPQIGYRYVSWEPLYKSAFHNVLTSIFGKIRLMIISATGKEANDNGLCRWWPGQFIKCFFPIRRDWSERRCSRWIKWSHIETLLLIISVLSKRLLDISGNILLTCQWFFSSVLARYIIGTVIMNKKKVQ